MTAEPQSIPTPKAYTLSTLLRNIRSVLKSQLGGQYWIVGEVSSIRSSRGHYYLELTETEGGVSKARVQAIIWAGKAGYLLSMFESVTGEKIKAGMQLMLLVSVEYSELYGISLQVHDINAEYTLGAFERLKRETLERLTREGVIEMNKSLPLPLLLLRVAVISSPQAAGWEDFMKQISQSEVFPLFHIDLYDAVMQGRNTTETVCAALDKILFSGKKYDAVLLLRGGGSRHDLSAFDEYNLCASLAQFPLPVLTGIGHERDESVADVVAHTRLKTPTALAEFLIRRAQEALDRLLRVEESLAEIVKDLPQQMVTGIDLLARALHDLLTRRRLEESRHLSAVSNRLSIALHQAHSALTLETLRRENRLIKILEDRMKLEHSTLDRITYTAQSTIRAHLDAQQSRLNDIPLQLRILLPPLIRQAHMHLDSLEKVARGLDPRRIISRGFIPVTQADRQINRIGDIDPNLPVTLMLMDGKATADIRKITPDD